MHWTKCHVATRVLSTTKVQVVEGCSCPVKPFGFLLVPVLLLYLTMIAAGHVTPPGRRGWAALEHVHAKCS